MSQYLGSKNHPIADSSAAMSAIQTLACSVRHQRIPVNVDAEALAESSPAQAIISINPKRIAIARHSDFVTLILKLFVAYAYASLREFPFYPWRWSVNVGHTPRLRFDCRSRRYLRHAYPTSLNEGRPCSGAPMPPAHACPRLPKASADLLVRSPGPAKAGNSQRAPRNAVDVPSIRVPWVQRARRTGFFGRQPMVGRSLVLRQKRPTV
jgi:hypothetical protein